MKRRLVSWTMVALAAAAFPACTDVPPTGPAPGGSDPLSPNRSADLPGLRVSASRRLTEPAPTAFVSMLPGSIEGEAQLVLRPASGSAEVRVPLVGGGTDPVTVPALPGDELLVDVLRGGAVLEAAVVSVMPTLPPIVIRTDPTRRRTSVPVNIVMTVVFSEPIAPASVTAQSVRLSGGGAEVEVIRTLRSEGTILEIRPTVPLRYSTDYTLDVGTGIADLSGDHLVDVESVSFSTEACVPADTTPFAVRLMPDSLILPVGSSSGFAVAVDSGARIINTFPDASLTWSSSDSAIVRPLNGAVDALAIGQAYVRVEYDGEVDSALVIVTESPPPGPFGIFPGGATIPTDFELQFEITHPAGTEPPAVTWSSTDPAIFTVDAAGLVTSHAPGVARLVAVAGADADTAEIEVYDPTPPLGDLFVISPDTLLLQVGDLRQLAIVGAYWPEPPVTWSSGNAAVATVDAQGVLQAVGPGGTDITATFDDGSTATARVDVVPAGTLGYITLAPASITAAVGDTVRFSVTYDATAFATYGDRNVAWGTTSPNVQVLRYLASGVFEVIAAGSAEVRAYVGPLIARATVTAVP